MTVITVGSLVACNGGGTTTTPLTPAGGGSRSGQAVHTNGLTTFQSINADGGAVSPFSADADYSGGQTASTTAAVNTNVENAAPQAVYQTNRYGTFSYSLSGESPGAPYIVRLHFAELHFHAAGARLFNIAINSTTVLSNFDIYAAAGGMDKAVVEQFPVNASSSGVISIGFTRVKEQPEVSGIENVRENLLTEAPVEIAAGNGSAVSSFSADNDFNGGYTEYDASHKIDTSAVANPPPPGVFYGQRVGTSFRYVFTGLTPNSSYNLRLDFMERYFDAPKQRVFNVAVNGNQFLTNYDIFADAGAMYKATAKSVTVNADRSGNITAVFTALVNVAKVNGLELSAATTATPPPYSSKIQHVVVIIQENRSFDNLFYGFPGADTAQSGINSQGRTIPLAPVTLEAHHDPAHNHTTFVTQYDGGKNDAFDKGGFDFFPTTAPNYQYAYVPHSETSDYFSLGEKYTVGDRMFTSNSGPSYVSHQYLIAGQAAMVAEVPSHVPWGCDAPSSTTTTLLNNKGQEVPGPFPCFNYQTLGDLMDAKGVTWAYYAPAYSAGPSGYIWSAYDAIKHIRYGSDWTESVQKVV